MALHLFQIPTIFSTTFPAYIGTQFQRDQPDHCPQDFLLKFQISKCSQHHCTKHQTSYQTFLSIDFTLSLRFRFPNQISQIPIEVELFFFKLKIAIGFLNKTISYPKTQFRFDSIQTIDGFSSTLDRPDHTHSHQGRIRHWKLNDQGNCMTLTFLPTFSFYSFHSKFH